VLYLCTWDNGICSKIKSVFHKCNFFQMMDMPKSIWQPYAWHHHIFSKSGTCLTLRSSLCYPILGVMVFNAAFNNISVIDGQFYWWRKPERPTELTLSHDVVSSTPGHELDSNSTCTIFRVRRLNIFWTSMQ
jgi:hypothetical protein